MTGVQTCALPIYLFADIAHELGKCVIVVTHSQAFSQKADVVVELEGKRLKAVQVRG